MRKPLVFGMFLLALAAAAEEQRRSVRHPEAIPRPRSVLWVAAHPDDEAAAAPLLSFWCREQGAKCTFLVLTRGEAGVCLLPGGCSPDVASVRAAEAAAAAQYFRADSIHLTLPDGGPWPAETAETIARYIEAVRPEVILTFDPRHGTTCHPDHRETGRLVLEAVPRLTFAPRVYLVESVFTVSPPVLRIGSASPEALRFDAASRWTVLEHVLSLHRSQFDRVPVVDPAERAVWLAPAEAILAVPVTECGQ